jgi:NAD(P)-dependent dehydrogenase (short-subunit alcohol dehydrogenase family)
MKNPLDFSGKVALITGAASGMGLATAQAFADAGAAVVLADFKEEAVKTAAQHLAGHKALAIRCDVSDDAQVAAMVDRAVADSGDSMPRSTTPVSWPGLHRLPTTPAKSGIA